MAAFVLASVGPLEGAELGSASLPILGSRFTVTPEAQTVPFETPTVIETHVDGADGAAMAVGDLVGPEIAGFLRLEARPGEAFRIPRLRQGGEYRLKNIRLERDGSVVAFATPREASVLVTQVLVTSVTSRPLTFDEVRARGIVIGDGNTSAFDFTFAFGVGSESFTYNVPVISSFFAQSAGGIYRPVINVPEDRVFGRTARSRFTPPKMVPFTMKAPEVFRPDIRSGGCMAADGDCSTAQPRILPGVILFPTDIGLLNQFFSVVLVAQNGAPEADALVIRDLAATVRLPPGLRRAQTNPLVSFSAPIPVRVPGPDGVLGTVDDLTFIVAQASGQAEIEVEGVREGTHIVDFELSGVLEGLPTGPTRIEGSARGAVLVRDPSLGVSIHHPEVVRADEEYELGLTVTNTGNAPRSLIQVRLPAGGLSGVELLSAPNQSIEELAPGESESVFFRLRSRRTGKVIATSARTVSGIAPLFDLTISIGDGGIPLSPTSIILPESSATLPEALRREALSLIGLGHSLASAPASQIAAAQLQDLPMSEVHEHVYWLGQAGRHVELGDSLFDAVAELAAEWTGARYRSWGWDELRRRTRRGASVGAAMGDVLRAEAAGQSPVQLAERFLQVVEMVGDVDLVLAEECSSLSLETSSGGRLYGHGRQADRIRTFPFADLYDVAGAQLALVASRPEGGYVVEIDGSTCSGPIHVLRPGEQGLERLTWSHGLGPDARGTWTAGAGMSLEIDDDGDGSVDRTVVAVRSSVGARPFEVQRATLEAFRGQWGHVVTVFLSRPVDVRSLAFRDPGTFLDEGTVPERFVIAGRTSNGGLVQTERRSVAGGPFSGMSNTRIVSVTFDNPISPYLEDTMTVEDIWSHDGLRLPRQVVELAKEVGTPGIALEGRLIDGNGEPVANGEVVLWQSDVSDWVGACAPHVTAVVPTDAEGRYRIDYVRDTCGGGFTVRGRDPETGLVGQSRGRTRLIGQTQTMDILMVGRATLRGTVRYEDGSVPEQATIAVQTMALGDGRTAAVAPDGAFEVSELAVGTVTVLARDRLGNHVLATLEIPHAGTTVERDLVILRRPPNSASATLAGVVVSPREDTPVSGAWVAIYHEGAMVGVQRSGADGRFDFGLVPAGIYELDAFDGFTGLEGARLTFTLEPDRHSDITVRLVSDFGAVEGYVFDRDLVGGLTPVAGAIVWVVGTPLHQTTDANGYYFLEGVVSGSPMISVAHPESGEIANATVAVSADGLVRRDLFFDAVGQLENGISGLVLGLSGNPVAGAIVHLAGGDGWSHEAHTNAQGRFAFVGLHQGGYDVHALKGNLGGTAPATIRFQGDTASVTIRFETGTITGQVFADAGTDELVGVRSQVFYRTTAVALGMVILDPAEHLIDTDDQGRFEIPNVLVGPYVLSIRNAFYGDKTIRGELIDQGQVDHHEVVFERNGEIRGVVLDIDGATPKPGVRVDLRHPNFAVYDLVTDEAGAFTFPLVPPARDRFPIEATFDDGSVHRTAQVWVTFTRFGQELDVELTLSKQGAVAGWIEDSFGKPVPGAIVTLREGAWPRRTLTQNADGEGFYVFTNVFEGAVSVTAQAPALGGLGGSVSGELTAEGEELFLPVILEPTGEIEGVITSPVDGSVVPTARVTLQNWFGHYIDSITSDQDGRFRFTLLPLEVYQVWVFDPHTGRSGRIRDLAIGANGEIVDGSLELEVRGDVQGHLLEPGVVSGVPGATVRLLARSLLPFVTYSSTDALGFFEFQGIPEGTFDLFAKEPAGRRRAWGSGEISEEDEVVTVDITLEHSGRVFGIARNPVGMPDGPFEHANVVAMQGGYVLGGSLTNPYSFSGIIAEQRFELWASENGGKHRGWVAGRLPNGQDELEVDVRMWPRGSLVVEVRDSFDNLVGGADVSVYFSGSYGYGTHSGSTDAAGRFAVADVGQGGFSASARNPANQLRGSASGSLSTEGQVLELAVRLESSGWVRGRVLLSDGQTPAAGSPVVLLVSGRTLRAFVDETGAFELAGVPMGSYTLILQEHLGPGAMNRYGTLAANGEVDDLGDLVLDDHSPTVASIAPASGSRDLQQTLQVVIRFSEPIWKERWNNNWVWFRSLAGNWVGFTRSWSEGDTVLTLTPNQPLASATGYEVIVQGVEDLAGRTDSGRSRSVFYTRDYIAPTVIDTLPRNGQKQVSAVEPIAITFSEPIAAASLNGAAMQLADLETGAGVSTTWAQTSGGRLVRLSPLVGTLETDRQYRVRVVGVSDLAGNVMTTPVETTFWTTDTLAPTVTVTSPASGSSFEAGETVDIAATVADVHGVSRVTFELGPWSFVDTAAPWQWSVPAPIVEQVEDLDIVVRAVDVHGNERVVHHPIEVVPHANTEPPTIEATCVREGDFVAPGQLFEVAFASADDVAVESVRLLIDGAEVDELSPVGQAAVSEVLRWTVPDGASGPRLLELRARDFAGQTSTFATTVQVATGLLIGSVNDLPSDGVSTEPISFGPGVFVLSQRIEAPAIRLLQSAVLSGVVDLKTPGPLHVQCGARLDVTGLGYGGGSQWEPIGGAPAGSNGSTGIAGGSHGGLGGVAYGLTSAAGEVFDSVYQPMMGGGGGGASHANPGGGVVSLVAAEVLLDGEVRADGASATTALFGSSGAGGSALVRAGLLLGSGRISVRGGDGAKCVGMLNGSGPGAGGRISVIADDQSSSLVELRAEGGVDCTPTAVYGGPGTVYVKTSESTYGSLRIDSGLETNGTPRQPVPPTPLPTLGSGTVIALVAEVADLWVTAELALRPRWRGAWMELFDAAGGSLGVFEVLDLDESGRVLLRDAGEFAGQAATYLGHYRFDTVELLNGAGMVASDPVELTTQVFEGETSVSGVIRGVDGVVKAGAVVRPASGGTLQFELSGRLTVEAGARLDVTGLGYRGGSQWEPIGGAPAGSNGSTGIAGGSHGGLGGVAYGLTSAAGEVFDSVYQPMMGGGGGGASHANPGGGVVSLVAAEVLLDGEVRADGASATTALFGSSGAGGSALVRAGLLLGSGRISVRGGDGAKCVGMLNGSGPGAGGRISVIADDQSSSLVELRAEGGVDCTPTAVYGGPGTVYVKTSESTYGSLRIDSGLETNGTPRQPVPLTPLPTLGTGLAFGAIQSGADLWIEPADTATLPGLGLRGMWARVAGVDYPILDQAPERRRFLLDGAAGQVADGDEYLGFYKFDEVHVLNGAQLVIADGWEIGNLVVDAHSSVDLRDQTPPVVVVAAPTPAQVFAAGENIPIALAVSDDRAVGRVELSFGDRSETLLAAPWTWSVPAPVVEVEQDLNLLVTAYDTSGNLATIGHPIRIRPLAPGDPPEVAILCPTGGAMAAPGTGFVVHASATHDEGVEKVEVFVDTATEPASTDFSAPYQLPFVLPADVVDGTIVPVRIVGRSFNGRTAEQVLLVRVVEGSVFTANTSISATDLSHDGGVVVVSGGRLEIAGARTFRDLVVLDGATLSHAGPAQTLAGTGALDLTVTGNLFVACGAAIDVSGRGFSATYSLGAPIPASQGGTHGGRGGRFAANAVTPGGIFDPRLPGGGGGAAGGGRVALKVLGDAVVDGVIRADGAAHTGGNGGGAGGSIRLDATGLSGAGAVSARGGHAPAGAGGGGGRVAIYASSIDPAFLARTDIGGGTGTNAAATGAAGTLFTRRDEQLLGDLVIDDRGRTSTQVTEIPAVGFGLVDAVDADSFSDPLGYFVAGLYGHEVAFDGDLEQTWTVLANAHLGPELELHVDQQALTAAAGSEYRGLLRFDSVTVGSAALVRSLDPILATIDVAPAASFFDAFVPTVSVTAPESGAAVASGETLAVTATFDSPLGTKELRFRFNGQTTTRTTSPWSASFVVPPVAEPTPMPVVVELIDGSGRRWVDEVEVMVVPLADPFAPTVVANASCPSNGDFVVAGQGVSVPFVMSDNEAITSWRLLVDDVVVNQATGLNSPNVNQTLSWTVPTSALPGQTFVLRAEARDYAFGLGFAEVHLTVPTTAVRTGTQNLDAAVDGTEVILGAGTFTLTSPIAPTRLVLMNGAIVKPAGELAAISATEEVRVQCGGRIDAEGKGYPGAANAAARGGAPAWVLGPIADAGGAHGGLGIGWNTAGEHGEVFDSVYAPSLGGGGGASDEGTCCTGWAGGGVVRIAAPVVSVDGEVRASAASGNNHDNPTGAGGTVVVAATTLRGRGLVTANGGSDRACDSGRYTGVGGGGRIALLVDDLIGFDPAAQAEARGGARAACNWSPLEYASPGTVFVKTAGSTYGDLHLDNGRYGSTPRTAQATPLPQLGEGEVVGWIEEGSTVRLTGAQAFRPRWLGAWVTLVDSSGNDLGAFEVVEVSGNELILADAVGLVDVTSYRGEYRFDSLAIRNGAGVRAEDPIVVAGEVVGADTVKLPAVLRAESFRLAAGAVATPAFGSRIAIEVADTVTIEAGARIDLRSGGYEGGATAQAGVSPPWVVAPGPDAGGSHGGIGIGWDSAGEHGEVFDSVYRPTLPGGGGAGDQDACCGGLAGGGVLEIAAGALELHGDLDVSGLSGDNGHSPTGAGGTVVLELGVISGNGRILANGGTDRACDSSRNTGAGGGGRVSISVDDLGSFDISARVEALGGARAACSWSPLEYASPGTIYVRRTGSTYGELHVDSGRYGSTERRGRPTPLPVLGSGAITGWAVIGSDGDLTADGPFRPRWLGTWVELESSSGELLGTHRVIEHTGTTLRLEGAGAIVGAARYRGVYRFDAIHLRNGAGLASEDPLSAAGEVRLEGAVRVPALLSAGSLRLVAGTVATPAVGNGYRLEVEDTLTIEPGARLDARGRGYAGGAVTAPGIGPDWVEAPSADAGGSHGGVGIGWTLAGESGEAFDSVYRPTLSGGGGAGDEDTCCSGFAGGGVIEITTGSLALGGEIDVSGLSGNNENSPTGAGGTVWIEADALWGTGKIYANGGSDRACDSSRYTGVGGGGRVALHVDWLDGFLVESQVKAEGGARADCSWYPLEYASPGTVFVKQRTSELGDLFVMSGKYGSIDRRGRPTPLPALGEGAAASVETVDDDLWIAAAQPFRPRWLGAWMRVFAADGADLGVFEVVGLDDSGRARLADAGPAAGQVATWAGEYHFRHIALLQGAGLDSTDPLLSAGELRTSGAARLPPRFVGTELRLTTGTTATPARGSHLALSLEGTMRVESGAVLSVDGVGYAGGVSAAEPLGAAPWWATPSAPDAGGSHGAPGIGWDIQGSGGPAYGSVYHPDLPGGGAAFDNDTCCAGQRGAGTISIDTAALVVDGTIQANGGVNNNADTATGAGGSIAIVAGSLSGGGMISANGGLGRSCDATRNVGAGGGGRIALYLGTPTSFSLFDRVTASGGGRANCAWYYQQWTAPGTVLVHQPGNTAGELILTRLWYGSVRTAPATPLPTLGSASILLTTPTGDANADLLVTADRTLVDDWLGVFVELEDSGGGDLGTYRALDVTESGQLLLDGAGSVVGAATLRGTYRFDRIHLLNGATFTAQDPVIDLSNPGATSAPQAIELDGSALPFALSLEESN